MSLVTPALAIVVPFLFNAVMAFEAALTPRSAGEGGDSAAMHHRPWRSRAGLSSVLDAAERFLASAGFDRAPWLAVAFAAGIATWFALPNRWSWLALLAGCMSVVLGTLAALRVDGRFPYLRQATMAVALTLAAGCAVVWLKSALVGERAISRPMVETLAATVIGREDQPAERRVRLMLETREPGTGRAIKVRLNLPIEMDRNELREGAQVQLRARLMPPAAPMLPGGHDFARSARFAGLAATGSVLGEVEIFRPGNERGWFEGLQSNLSQHVCSRLDGSAGTIAAAFASGDRGAIAERDDEAMRDAGLTHLLSISGLHVSAVVAATWFIAIKLLALWPWLALRVRLPILAAGLAALSGILYTLVTGAEVPTVRSCIGAVLVLAALTLGREPLSLRMLAVAAFLVMLLWPEAVVGPSFQMSFASVIAIVSLHGSAPVKTFLAAREEPWWARTGRRLLMLLLTGVAIELALMPIGLFHFHRAGVYGAFANVIAIPLTTFITMPLIAISLVLDLAGMGGPLWWLTGQSIDLMLEMAHWIAAQPGAVTLLPAMGKGSIVLFTVGALWLALWRGKVRLAGLLPIVAGVLPLALLKPPDILVSGDGRHIGITGEADGGLLVLREARSDFARDNLTELAGMNGAMLPMAKWPDARCSRDFCAITLHRAGREWHLLLSRTRELTGERALAAACDRADIVISDRWLPRSCKPAMLKIDRRMLSSTGGLSIDLGTGSVRTVAHDQGEHGWWQSVGGMTARRSLPQQPGTEKPPITKVGGSPVS
ncbi:MAG: ComEC/Rec2 family competence protein [Novosphingobium sp.]